MRLLDQDDHESNPPDVSRLCTTTWVLKDFRTKYCTQTCACIQEFDHYCIWLNRAIGRGNHREFIFHVTIEVGTQLCHVYLLIIIGRQMVEHDTFRHWVQHMFSPCTLMGNMMLAHFFTAP